MAAVRFDGTIDAAMREHFIEREIVRSTKEQADILLTVLAMDYLHQGVKTFTLVTGDQDFIPLIMRLYRDGCRVTVIYGDPRRLSAELRRTLATSGVESIDIGDVTTLRERTRDSGCRSLLGLLELQRRGFIIGGKEKGERTALLAQWGVLKQQEETEYWSLIDALTEKVTRYDAAVPASGGVWLPKNAIRTYLRITPERMADVVALDHLVRLLSARPKGLTIGGLRSGPFQTDSGALLDRALDALTAAGLVRKGADDAFSMSGTPMPLGYLEPLWRMHAGLSAECYRRRVTSIPYSQLTGLLGRRGLGQGPEQRAAGRIGEAVDYARAAGVIDAVSVERKRHVMVGNSQLCRPIEQAYHTLYAEFSTRVGPIAEAEVTSMMEERDGVRSVPLFGYDQRDRSRVLRVLAQSQLITSRDEKIVFARTNWGDSGSATGS